MWHDSDGHSISVCQDCYDELNNARIDELCSTITSPSSFSSMSKSDMSECFWAHLGRYVKRPNQKSWSIIMRAYGWACHDDHGLSNSFRHAMEWVGLKRSESMPAGLPEE